MAAPWIPLVLLGSGLVACENRFPKPFYIARRSTVEVLTGPGRYVLDAECRTGEQLLGGGYLMPDIDGNDGLHVGVVATYPSNQDTWRVIFENPETAQSRELEGLSLRATAYCLTTPDFPVDIVIATAQGGQGSASPEPSVAASCPAGSVLTGGGYRTAATSQNFAWYNANVMVSAPTIDASGRATGWQVGLHYLPQLTIPVTTVYALCATQNLVAGPVVLETVDLTTAPPFWGWFETAATCPRNMFTTAGGYSLIGDPLIPHLVSFSDSRSQFARWKFRGAFGFQTPSYDFRPCDPQLNPACATAAAFAACVEIPDIPFVHVAIIEPMDEAHFPPLLGSTPTVTAPITFTAEATDEMGAPLGGSALQWFRDGIPFGTGVSVTSSMPASRSGIDFINIRVVATGATTTDFDQIRISVGQIQ